MVRSTVIKGFKSFLKVFESAESDVQTAAKANETRKDITVRKSVYPKARQNEAVCKREQRLFIAEVNEGITYSLPSA